MSDDVVPTPSRRLRVYAFRFAFFVLFSRRVPFLLFFFSAVLFAARRSSARFAAFRSSTRRAALAAILRARVAVSRSLALTANRRASTNRLLMARDALFRDASSSVASAAVAARSASPRRNARASPPLLVARSNTDVLGRFPGLGGGMAGRKFPRVVECNLASSAGACDPSAGGTVPDNGISATSPAAARTAGW